MTILSCSWLMAQPCAITTHGALVVGFGAQAAHQQLQHLGPEPLTADFDGGRALAIGQEPKSRGKAIYYGQQVVVGVGNIYASEALFRSGIRPDRAAGKVSQKRYQVLAGHIKEVLAAAIEQGGTTLRDFVNSHGEPGYFQQTLAVYGRAGKQCTCCNTVLKELRLGQRSSVFCPSCQR